MRGAGGGETDRRRGGFVLLKCTDIITNIAAPIAVERGGGPRLTDHNDHQRQRLKELGHRWVCGAEHGVGVIPTEYADFPHDLGERVG